MASWAKASPATKVNGTARVETSCIIRTSDVGAVSKPKACTRSADQPGGHAEASPPRTSDDATNSHHRNDARHRTAVSSDQEPGADRT